MSEQSSIEQNSKRGQRLQFWLEFLGSMNLAITILVVVALSSIIGTVLQQNQPYQNYIIKFGPFWHEVFRTLGLYDVYGAIWFLLLLGFLVLSTSVCIYRNAPTMLRDINHFRLKVKEKSLRSMHNTREWQSSLSCEETEQQFTAFLTRQSYRIRRKEKDGQVLLAAMKGGLNRLGYLFTHLGIVVICVGGLMDGNLPMTVKEWLGIIKVETRDISTADVPADSRLKPGDSASFRGSITIPESGLSNLVFLNVRDGYLVQELPFAVELKDFRIQHYDSGQPKSFESDLVIHDDQLKQPLTATIAVNKPLEYRGYSIYQASFADGGSGLELRAWPFFHPLTKPFPLKAKVNRDRQIATTSGEVTLEFNEFKLYNIFPAEPDDPSGKQFKNFGPSVTFKVRDTGGQAREYLNYMLPVLQEGRRFFLSGMRSATSESFRYLHIPVDAKNGIDRFMQLHAAVNDPLWVKSVIDRSMKASIKKEKIPREMQDNIKRSMTHLLELYNKGGFVAIDEDIKSKVPTEKRAQVAEAYIKILRNVLLGIYMDVLKAEGLDVSKAIPLAEQQFFEDAVRNMAGISAYGSPFYLQLVGFDHVEASGLQITRSPGKNMVYLGSAMLILGVFFMFYITHQRLWCLFDREGESCRVIFAGSGNRNQYDFTSRFNALAEYLNGLLKSSQDNSR